VKTILAVPIIILCSLVVFLLADEWVGEISENIRDLRAPTRDAHDPVAPLSLPPKVREQDALATLDRATLTTPGLPPLPVNPADVLRDLPDWAQPTRDRCISDISSLVRRGEDAFTAGELDEWAQQDPTLWARYPCLQRVPADDPDALVVQTIGRVPAAQLLSETWDFDARLGQAWERAVAYAILVQRGYDVRAEHREAVLAVGELTGDERVTLYLERTLR